VNALGCIGMAFALVDAFLVGTCVGPTAMGRELVRLDQLTGDSAQPWPVHDSDTYVSWMHALYGYDDDPEAEVRP
jgi:hypothetical protein